MASVVPVAVLKAANAARSAGHFNVGGGRSDSVTFLLAGGLTPENVAEAILYVRPYAVDVASGVESSPGKKSRAKLRHFFAEVSRANKQL